jgi:hypothetical protein
MWTTSSIDFGSAFSVIYSIVTMLMDQMRIAILQADKMVLDRVRLGTFEDEEAALLHALAGDFAAHGLGGVLRVVGNGHLQTDGIRDE